MYTKYAKHIRVGTTMMHKQHGHGVCKRIDHKSKAFRYFFEFDDGTLKWMSDIDCENGSKH